MWIIAQRWNAFWFAEIPSHSYALLRVAFGVLGLLGLLGLTPVSMYWPLDSLATRPGEGLGLKAYIGELGLGTVAGWGLYVLLLLSFCSMTIGFLTPLSVAAAFGASTAQSMWNSLPLSSSHQVLVSVLFCLIWADCGGAFSIDSRRGERRWAAFTTRAIWPLQLIRIQIALIYLNSGLWKLFGPTWRDGSAGHDALNVNVFHRFPVTIPENLEWLVTSGTYVTLLWEMTFPLLLLNPFTRQLALLVGVAVHLGLWIGLEVGTFSWVMLASYLAFVDPSTITSLFSRISNRFERLCKTYLPKSAETRSTVSFLQPVASSNAQKIHESLRD